MQKLYELSAKDVAAEFGEPVPADEDDAGLFTSDEQEISGLGVEAANFNDEEAENTITELLNSLNASENADMAAAIEQERKDREEYLRQENENYQKRLASVEEDYNRKRYEAEQAAKKERLAREEEERRLEEEEERRAQEASFKGKLSKLFKKKPKKEEEEPEVIVATPEVEEVPAEATPTPTEPAPAEAEVSVGGPEEESFEFDLSEGVDTETAEYENITPQSEAIEPEEVKAEAAASSTVSEKEEAKTEEAKPAKEEKKSIFSVFAKKEKPEKAAKPIISIKKPKKQEPVPVVESAAVPGEPDWKYIALHDDATGMLNSRAYHDIITKVPNTVAVVFFDINNLKYVNDRFSHHDGDELIKACASSIMKHFGDDKTYRVGGDEFVVLLPGGKKIADQITETSSKVHKDLQECFKRSEKHIPHSISIGYAIGDGEHSVDDIVKAADASMYRNKKAYKQAHPEYNMRNGEPEQTGGPVKEKVEKDHDELLNKDQRGLKEKIKNKHQMPTVSSTKNLIREIQKKAGEVHAILVASPTFDHLFIIRNVDEFISLVLDQEAMIDYSYLYVVWDGGSQYYGADEYYNEVTDIFKEIAEGLVSGKFKSEKDVRSVKGINIFRNVYL